MDYLMEKACSVVGRNFTRVEWGDYFPNKQYRATCPQWPLDIEYITTVAKDALSDTNDPNRVKTALDKVIAALKTDNTVEDANKEALKIVNAAVAEQILAEATPADIEKALDLFEQAKQMQISVNNTHTLNKLCWLGSLQGYAEKALRHCESAVKLAPDDGGIRDSRGLARALTGDYQGAILDFQYFIDHPTDSTLIEQRKQWIEQLKKGINPFTPEILESLK